MRLFKVILAVELIICFIWPAYMVVVCAAFGLLGIVSAFDGDYWGLFFTLLSITGIAGLYGIAQTYLKIATPSLIVESPRIIFFCLCAGVVAIILASFIMNPSAAQYAFLILPLLVTAHFVYLARGYLFGLDAG
ncbi:hypothetical protein QP938_08915 [Porticoccaceae bacterium LTM1]|nr:hypothetical protein QP938_08915 [Porticoccaceae bacterium LTM1]